MRSAGHLAGVALLLAASVASAQPKGAAAEAAKMFDEAKVLFEAERFAEACDKLARSDALDPGVGTLGLLAACHAKLGRVATARREYAETAERARAARDDREAFARAQAAALELKVPTLTVHSEGHEPGLAVTRGGAPLPIDVTVELDPGTYSLAATAPGMGGWHADVTLAAGEKKIVALPPLQPALAEPAASASPEPARPAGTTQRTLGFVGLGVGAVGVGVGVVAGVLVLSQRSDLDADPGCPNRCADADAVDAFNTKRHVSTIGFVIGGVGLAAGAVALLTAPRSAGALAARPRALARPHLSLRPGGAGLEVVF